MVLAVPPERKNRLIVLLPESLAGDLELAHKVYWMAIRDQCDVLYLTLVDHDEKMVSIARAMATMKVVTAENCLFVENRLVDTNQWLAALEAIYQPGDRVACHAEQVVRSGFLKTAPAADFLRARMNAHTLTIAGFYHPHKVQVEHWFRGLGIWIGFLVIMALFTVLEIQLDQAIPSLVGKILLIILVMVEIGTIWAWDSFNGQ